MDDDLAHPRSDFVTFDFHDILLPTLDFQRLRRTAPSCGSL
jgi:hypothetical protein